MEAGRGQRSKYRRTQLLSRQVLNSLAGLLLPSSLIAVCLPIRCAGQSMRPVAKLDHETDPPDSNSHHADSDAKIGCRPDRTGDNPDDASKDDRERNEIGEDFVAHHSIRLART